MYFLEDFDCVMQLAKLYISNQSWDFRMSLNYVGPLAALLLKLKRWNTQHTILIQYLFYQHFVSASLPKWHIWHVTTKQKVSIRSYAKVSRTQFSFHVAARNKALQSRALVYSQSCARYNVSSIMFSFFIVVMWCMHPHEASWWHIRQLTRTSAVRYMVFLSCLGTSMQYSVLPLDGSKSWIKYTFKAIRIL